MTKLDPIAAPKNDDEPPPDTVLVVDDSMGQRTLLSRILSRMGLRVLAADSGEAALAVCEAEKPDIIVSDWMMPGMDGLEFCRTFRERWGDRYSYFILLTSKDEKADVADGLDAGADDFLTKPVNPHELKARIRAGQRVLGMERELTEKNRLIGATLDEMRGLHARIDSDLQEAQKLQQDLVPERVRRISGYDLSLLLEPAGRVGGDLVGLFDVNPGEFGIFSLDVSGHGIASALMTVRLAGYLSGMRASQNLAISEAQDGTPKMRGPAEVAERLNDIVLNDMETEQYFTMVLARVDVASGRVSMVQAGHPHPIVHRADGSVDQVGEGGMPIGLIPGAAFSEFEVSLAPGDRLFIGSDGITECMNPDGTLLGEDGLSALLQANQNLADAALFDALLAKLVAFSGKDEFDDDVSAAVIKRLEPSPE